MTADSIVSEGCGYSVRIVNGKGEIKEQKVYPARVRQRFPDKTLAEHTMYFACVESEFSEPVELRVQRCGRGGETCTVRPLSRKIPIDRQDEEIVLTLSQPENLSVEFDGDMYENLFLFVHRPEPRPIPAGENVLYFGPGEHEAGLIELTSHQTLYLDSGAIVYGRIHAKDAEDITIGGYGILDGSGENHTDSRPYHICLEDCRNVRLENIVIRDSPAWCVVPMHCRDVVISGIKQISYNWNSDGFDICSCDTVDISHVFIRNFDDNISLKSFGGNCRNITFRDSVVWCDCAHNMLVGPEADLKHGTVFENISFRNVTVLESSEYCEMYQGVMAIMCADGAVIRDVSWDGITVERASSGKLLHIRYVTEYAKELGQRIEDIAVSHVVSYEKALPVAILGADEVRKVKNVRLCSVTYAGGHGDLSEHLNTNEFTENITIAP